ncbi:hypothetical protein PHLCEN_2v10167 [Hermanssonia centrifuga]|uniref:Uncharacterized protein n=1 Tax=Hermanssonia centrifuga TaxID=98765 RepID=A0A2R6NNR0_9APHY|nr:hypothetical protein PHLCEN_2v10167 [Hermanssonia centrifuga]
MTAAKSAVLDFADSLKIPMVVHPRGPSVTSENINTPFEPASQVRRDNFPELGRPLLSSVTSSTFEPNFINLSASPGTGTLASSSLSPPPLAPPLFATVISSSTPVFVPTSDVSISTLNPFIPHGPLETISITTPYNVPAGAITLGPFTRALTATLLSLSSTSFTPTTTSFTPPPSPWATSIGSLPVASAVDAGNPRPSGSRSTDATLVVALPGSLGAVAAILEGYGLHGTCGENAYEECVWLSVLTSTASPEGTRFPKLFGGCWGSGQLRKKMTAPISAPSEDTMNHEHAVQQSGEMIRRAYLDVESGIQSEYEKAEDTSAMSRHASSARACYGGPPPVPSLPSSMALTSDLSVSRRRQAEDGGVRIAGGRPGADDQADTGSHRTIMAWEYLQRDSARVELPFDFTNIQGI